MKCVVVRWGDAYRLSRQMALNVKKAGYKPDLVVAISRGGLVPARILCDVLGIMDLVSVKVEHWYVTGEHTERAVIKYPLNADLTGKKVLVVDDITDTGSSLTETVKHVSTLNPLSVKTATMQHLIQSSFKPDFTGEVVKDWAWFIYPWNFYEDLSNLTLRLLRNHPELKGDPEELSAWFRRYYGIRVSRKRLREAASMLCERGLTRWEGKALVLA